MLTFSSSVEDRVEGLLWLLRLPWLRFEQAGYCWICLFLDFHFCTKYIFDKKERTDVATLD